MALVMVPGIQITSTAVLPLLVAVDLSTVADHWHVTISSGGIVVCSSNDEANNGTSSKVDLDA